MLLTQKRLQFLVVRGHYSWGIHMTEVKITEISASRLLTTPNGWTVSIPNLNIIGKYDGKQFLMAQLTNWTVTAASNNVNGSTTFTSNFTCTSAGWTGPYQIDFELIVPLPGKNVPLSYPQLDCYCNEAQPIQQALSLLTDTLVPFPVGISDPSLTCSAQWAQC